MRVKEQASVLLVGFQDQGNLGIGYLAAMLMANGHYVQVVDIKEEPEEITRVALTQQPDVVGFTVIFQFYLPQFAAVARLFRVSGLGSHLTAGGHFPSLCGNEVFEAIPELDSIVQFEGEYTLLELAERVAAGTDWRDVPGVLSRRGGNIYAAPPRPLVKDLDTLPHPYRPRPLEQVLGIRAVPVLASRGCVRRCTFCSIHEFYRAAPGRLVRIRRPAEVVREMRELYERRGARIFLFQDDDFPLWGRRGRAWVNEIVDELELQHLLGHVAWKISCRADDVEPQIFAGLRDAGLYLVYLGLESGTDQGLQGLNKQLSVSQSLAGVAALKRLGITMEYGFMLFDPFSTFESVRANVSFLRKILEDGSGGVTFCRMLPYGGTAIRDRLRAEGRLRGGITDPDYDFTDPRLNEYHQLLDTMTAAWLQSGGVSHQLNWAWHEVAVLERFFPQLDGMNIYRAKLADLCSRSNELLLSLVESSSQAFEDGDRSWLDPQKAHLTCDTVVRELLSLRNAFIARHQTTLLPGRTVEPVG